jgi:hypothetical protein
VISWVILLSGYFRQHAGFPKVHPGVFPIVSKAKAVRIKAYKPQRKERVG